MVMAILVIFQLEGKESKEKQRKIVVETERKTSPSLTELSC